jgi:hypothetical protein
MKKLLILILAIGVIVWFRQPILLKILPAKVATAAIPKSNFIIPDPEPVQSKPVQCMTLAEFTQQANTDPLAYNKLLQCDQQPQERTAFDKLMNLFSRAKYE